MEETGKKIKQLRKSKRMTSKDLAEAAGLEERIILSIENGCFYANSDFQKTNIVRMLARALGVSPESLVFDEPIKNNIAANIRHYRHQQNMTQRELARKSGMSKRTIITYETNPPGSISDERLSAVAAALGVGVRELTAEPGEQTEPYEPGKSIRYYRKERGLTQTELADMAGLDQAHISRMEKGKMLPRGVTLEKIAAALDVTVEDLK